MKNESMQKFSSIEEMRAEHLLLLDRNAHAQDGALNDIAVFVGRGVNTGLILDDIAERYSAQGLLNYWINILNRYDIEIEKSILEDFDPLSNPLLPDESCPYVGLDTFQENKSNIFFGRDKIISNILEKLSKSNFVAVVGQSGSGKSSLVLGGVMPALKRGEIPGSEEWEYLGKLVPGYNPLLKIKKIHGEFEKYLGVEGVLLVIDQFEELYTLNEDFDAQNKFVSFIVDILKNPRNNIVITIRSDFEGYSSRFGDLYKLFENNRVYVTSLNEEELRETIEKPAEIVGLKFEDGVVDLLIQSLLGEPSGLPLLQFTLLKLWQNRKRNRITREIYDLVGGGKLALQRSADIFYDNLIPQDQILVRRILLRIISPSRGLEMTSGRIRKEMLFTGGESPEQIESGLQKLVNERLVRISEGDYPEEVQVEIAHEALVRNWPKLVQWVEEEYIDINTRRRLEARLSEWIRLGRGNAGLFDEVELQEAEQWLSSSKALYLGYNSELKTFANASRNAIFAEKQSREKNRNLFSQSRTNRRLAFIMGGIAIVIALAGTTLFLFTRVQGERLNQAKLALAADIVTTMSNLDAQIDYTQAALADPLDNTAAATLWEMTLRQRVSGLQQAFNSRPFATAPDSALLQVLSDNKADLSPVQRFYSNVREAQDDSQSLLSMMGSLSTARVVEERVYRLKEIDLQRRVFASSAESAYLWGMLALDSLGTSHDEIAIRFGQMKHLTPRAYTSRAELLASLDAESKTLAELVKERATQLQNAQQSLDESLKIQPDDTWDKVVGKAIALRKLGAIEQSAAAFKQYGAMFAASDPTAAQYSTVAQAFTPQAGALGVESAMYIYDVPAGSTGQQAGLQVGDIVLVLGGLPTPNATAFEAAQSQLPAGPVAVEALRLQANGTFARTTYTVSSTPIGISVMPI